MNNDTETSQPFLSKAKFVRIPITLLTLLKQDTSGALSIQHVREEQKEILFPRQTFEELAQHSTEDFAEFIKSQYPNTISLIIKYHERDGKLIPATLQVILLSNLESSIRDQKLTKLENWYCERRASFILKERLEACEKRIEELENQVAKLRESHKTPQKSF
ncbi:hypothetical protein KEJ26_01090 [Candidatus Bathyarchaeota archaeon]|nr:hypothetical protein [Candidatus Bathyarchaeota archaeon]